MIDYTAFGEIGVDGKVYKHDIKILPSGKIIKRVKLKGSHVVCLEEFKEILAEKPKAIVVGNGQDGVAEVEEVVANELKKMNIELIVQPTPKAIETFNKLKSKREKVGGIFHVTC
jgi:hypothetical protein